MAKDKNEEMRLPSLDELFSSQEERDDAKLKRIYEIPISEIDPFPDHPFHVRDDEDMMNLVESVKANGVITPATVRKKNDGRYELLSGHRRMGACELAGMENLRSEVVDMNRDEATVFMVESNFQRTTILPSEKAFAYIDEAISRLENDDFPEGINAIIFLLHKPAGQGTIENVLDVSDPRVEQFFTLVDKRHPFKVGMDSCNVPGAIRFCKTILPESLDTCEGGRYSCYIGADMIMVPCSFDQDRRYEVSLKDMSIEEAWNSEPFERFRDSMRKSCPECEKRELCLGGCPLMPEIVFCDSEKRIREE